MEAEENTTSIFDSIPDTYGGTAVAEPPKKVEPVVETIKDDDLLAAEKPDVLEDKKTPEKTPSQYAAERREAKQKRNELLEKAPVLEEENAKLKRQFEESQKRLNELESLTKKEREESAVTEDDIETLRTRAEAAESRYIAAHRADFNPYEDDDVKRHLSAVDDALRTNLPRLAVDANGKEVRLDLNLIRKDPARKGAIDAAVKDYAVSAESGDSTGMDRAVVVLGTALGNLDLDDHSLREKLDTALAAAADPFFKGVARFKEVSDNATTISQQRRAQGIAETESKILAPLRFSPEAIQEALSDDPSHPWANFGAFFNEVPEEMKTLVTEAAKQDASVLGAMAYTPPPLSPNATTAEIEKHSALVRGAQERAIQAARYITVGRLMTDGGGLAHLRAQAAEAKERLEEVGESLTIPNRGGNSKKEESKGAGGIWDSVPDNYARR